MSFNRDKFLAHLAHLTPQTQGRSLFLFDTVASTNTALSELLNTGAPIGSIAIALITRLHNIYLSDRPPKFISDCIFHLLLPNAINPRSHHIIGINPK